MLPLARPPQKTETHVEVRTALVHVPVRTVLPLLALLTHKVRTYLQVVAEVALVPVTALPQTLELVARLYLALVVRVRTVVRQPALAVDKLLAHSVGGQFVVVGWSGLLLDVGRGLVDRIVAARVGGLGGLGIHL